MAQEASEVRLESITEKDFLGQIREAAGLFGWATYHTYRSDRSEPGFPDLVLTNGSRLIFAEVKAVKGRLTSAQRMWQTLLSRVPGIEVYVFRPQDWDWVLDILQGKSA